ncbi:MAG: 50S ribosomal protein L24 [SAR324 cluster bacterium]|nr:50S ribosomal protein L24 [SAR324 cluster bacterium]
MKRSKDKPLHKTRLKRGDKVQVISGKSRGKVGKILVVNRKRGTFFIEGVNIQKKHVKPSQQNQRGGIIEKEGPVDFSNALLFSNKDGKGRRIGIELAKDGSKKRVFK